MTNAGGSEVPDDDLRCVHYTNLSHRNDRLTHAVRNAQSSSNEAQKGKIFPQPRHILIVKK